MASQKILEAKKQAVAELSEQIKNSVAGVFVDYSGITVADDTKLRKELREAGVKYSVIKNSIVKRATADAGIEGLDGVFEGTTAIATSTEDYVAAARILADYAEKNNNFVIKAGYMDGEAIDVEKVNSLAKIPPKDILLSQVLGTFLAPISAFACVLNQIKEKKEAGGEAAE